MTECVKRIDFNVCGDERGSLVALEKGCNLPFDVKRVYYIFDTGPDVTRGCHAHRNLKQMLVALSGRVDVTCEYGDRKETFTLDGLLRSASLTISGVMSENTLCSMEYHLSVSFYYI